MRSDSELLFHIRDEMAYIFEQTSLSTRNEFLENETLKRAFSRSLEIIGEAVKNLSSELVLSHADIEWRSLAGMRDKLIHGYFSVDYAIVWDVAVTKIPVLKSKIEDLIKNIRS
jgi:uncharacterized protein with HEPN domain